ncbi:PH domain-containing protein [Corynebacterium sp.]|uniref:PH domain-containing protein n=1 Tax=Corynebacterium sp. TaxID=1720 RepID=UPI0026DAEFDA|nr:PH domain-containing protein [Corynebacterium sp.]MDO5031219.1 PH domain-containing protein [Corynebacterium sp.]
MKRQLIDSDGFHRVHRLTPLLRFWSIILALLAVFALNLNASLLGDALRYLRSGRLSEIGLGTLIALGGFVLVCLVIWFVSELWWRKLGFALGEDDVALRHGVFTTAFRSARYERIQAVDVVEPVIARLFGLAAVRVETAGGRSSAIEIGYLRKAEAEGLRAELLHRVHGVDGADSADGAGSHAVSTAVSDTASHTAAEEPALIEEIPIRRTLCSELLRLPTLLTLLGMLVLVCFPLTRALAVPIIVGWFPSVWNLIDTSWRFSARHEEGRDDVNLGSDQGVVHISYGLADRRRQSIRLSRIHAVRVAQPTLWRFFGWYEVQVSVAGYGAIGGGKQSGSTRILPVGSREQALALFALVSELSHAQIEAYARPEGYTQPTYTSPRRAMWASPVDWSRQAVTLVEGPRPVAIVHSGRWCRRVAAVSTPHIQELTLVVRPLGHLLRLHDVRFDLVTGPVRMTGAELDPADAQDLLQRLRQRSLPPLEAPVSESGERGGAD